MSKCDPDCEPYLHAPPCEPDCVGCEIERMYPPATPAEINAAYRASHFKLIEQKAVLLEALKDLVRINEEHNESISKIIGKPLGWKDTYLDVARKAIAKVAK